MGPLLQRKVRRVHFIAAGGIGMSGIAQVLLNLGFEVTGSDIRESDNTRMLVEKGAIVHVGHKAEQIHGADVVVYSSAIDRENPEMVEAMRLNIPLISRAEMLAELMRMKSGIAVAGSHGKTTTTSMLSWSLSKAGLDPTFVVGGKLSTLATNARLGDGDYFVVEADESDGSFLKYSPVLSIVTNIDAEHLDYYHDLSNVKSAFLAFMNKVPFYGSVILCLDDENIQSILPKVMRPYVTYGINKQARYRAENIRTEGVRTSFDLVVDGQDNGLVVIHLPGEHNVRNALAVIAASQQLDLPVSVIKQALEEFKGVYRRFEFKGEARGVQIVDDYGHHPSEIRASLLAAQAAFPDNRIVAVFQPHRYSRVKHHFEQFAASFHDADLLVVTEIYAASEKPLPGVSGQALYEAIVQHGHRYASYEADLNAIAPRLAEVVRPGDMVITFGAGDVNKVGMQLLDLLGR